VNQLGFQGERDGRAIIARRLRALEHAPDYLEPGAVALLLRHAGGSGARLRAGLASVLFLASTEDAPAVDAALAARALGGMVPAAGPEAAPGVRGRRAALGAVAAAAALAAILVWQPEPPTFLAPEPLLHLAPDVSSPAQIVLEPTALPAPLPPAVLVRQPPVPPMLASLPEAPTASVLLLFPPRNANALAGLRPLALQLQQVGVAHIRARPAATPAARRVVYFFHADDAKLAQLIADTVARAHWPHTEGNSLQPLLVQSPPGSPAHAPGEIEVRLP